MNYRIAILALTEIFSALSIGVIILYTTYKILKYFGRKKLGIEQSNTAFSIFIASTLFAVGLMVSSVIEPIISSFRLLSSTSESSFEMITGFLGYGALYVLIAFSAGIIISLSGVIFYTNLTPIDEFKEIKNNNIGVSIIVSVIIITLVLMSKGGVNLLIESIIPYPELPPK